MSAAAAQATTVRPWRQCPRLQRKRMQPGRALSVLATLASISLEPLRACLEYELTPLDDDDDDDDRAEGSPAPSPNVLRLPLTAKATTDMAVFRDRQGER